MTDQNPWNSIKNANATKEETDFLSQLHDIGKIPWHMPGDYGQCVVCEGSDEDHKQDIIDSWGPKNAKAKEKLSFSKEAGFRSIPDCDHYYDNTKSWCQEVGSPTDIGDWPQGWGVAGFIDDGSYEASAYCPKHKDLHCLDNFDEYYVGCGNLLSKSGLCTNEHCGNYDAAAQNENIISGWAPHQSSIKQSIDYFSLDTGNANMPGMSQSPIGSDPLAPGVSPNPDSGMEDSMSQDFPGMHDYERGLSSAASKKQAGVTEAVFCDRCGRYGYHPDSWDNLLEEGWKEPKNNENKYYQEDNDSIYCPECWKEDDFCHRCGIRWLGKYNQCPECDGEDKEYKNNVVDAWAPKKTSSSIYCDEDGCDCPRCMEYLCWNCLEDIGGDVDSDHNCVDCHNCLTNEGKYGQCQICNQTDDEFEENTKDAWAPHGFDKKEAMKRILYYDALNEMPDSMKIKVASFEKIIFCDECGKPNPNFDEYTPKNWGRASLNGFDLPLRDAIHDNPRTAELGEYNENNELHYCPDCKDNRHLDTNISNPLKMTFGCGEPLGKYGQCEQCDETDENYEKGVKDAWAPKG